jgi:hypothetical protein
MEHITMKDSNNNNEIFASKKGNVLFHNRNPRRASQVFGNRATVYMRIKALELMEAGEECLSSRTHELHVSDTEYLGLLVVKIF